MGQAALVTQLPSQTWQQVFPGPRIPDVLTYVKDSWEWLTTKYAAAVNFSKSEPELTDNLCEALNNYYRKFANRIDCDFQPETRELRRNADGSTTYIARADIRVILGAPGTPHLVLEFKKLNGSTPARRQYCFDGLNRFIEGKYAVGHLHGAMCGFVCVDLKTEAAELAAYIADATRAKALACIPNCSANVITSPSAVAPTLAAFDTQHARATLAPANPILILHILLPCKHVVASPPKPRKSRKRVSKRRI